MSKLPLPVFEELSHCTLCPRECGADRLNGEFGYCNSRAEISVSSICIHKGEEPVISGSKGICNVFFSHCNLQCIYCQNHDISRNSSQHTELPLEMVVSRICQMLDQTENIVGFVSPSHFIPQMIAIIQGIRQAGKNPVFVYNTNGYDKVETLQILEGYIDIYLPDFKYRDENIAFAYSQARDYPMAAAAALKEMYRQKGSSLIVNENGIAESGIIVRHLVLPGAVQNSLDVLQFIAEEISPKLQISLMSQYFPTHDVSKHPQLSRTIYKEEYQQIVDAFYDFGFYRGWVQELISHATYRPDFSNEQPFEL
ncbi:MAG: radical SAM protein [Bacteroidota bacterium]|nr:radical SAM protein [Bacteroidota bacterium]